MLQALGYLISIVLEFSLIIKENEITYTSANFCYVIVISKHKINNIVKDLFFRYSVAV